MTCTLIINGQSVEASAGETLVDAALGGWIVVPHDCRSGQCESCRVTVLSGAVDDQGTAEGRTVLACQATIAGNAEIAFDEVPAETKSSGSITEISSLSPEVIEVVVALQSPLDYRAGQYLRVKFSGFPAREYSPTCRLDGSSGHSELVFHIRRLPGGLISTQLGRTIGLGHKVQVRGPFGNAFLREGEGPLVLVAGGTGWAPVWSVAQAARRSQRHREMVVVAGSRDFENLYMRPSLNWLIDDGVRHVVATCEFGATGPVRPGRPTHYLPLLGLEDTVFVAGPTGLVDAVKRKSRAAAARCYADPFLPSVQTPSLIDRVMHMLRTPADQSGDANVLSPRPLGGALDRVLGPLTRHRPAQPSAANARRPASPDRSVMRRDPG
ncbi:MAG TPA: 2Fe-2S iron-sulfur cluster-binding protein [Xanthobacteraceae bacterium]|jgi:3-phenylpropionate/trans-cinnamate dioxygenase ferredoxin reductase subunit|nr:2Fe-2S iron-sulfur cluster-binding protein [Xanthobacteraceae bacterium]